MCEMLGIPMNLLPDIYSCHTVVRTVTASAARQCGLIEGIPVVAGGLDAACGTLGAGVIHAGETQEQGGQAGGMSICIDEYRSAPADLRLPCGTGALAPSGWNNRRRSHALAGTGILELFSDIAQVVAPGSNGLVFLPYMAGERSPIWDSRTKGFFNGLYITNYKFFNENL